LKKVVIVGAGGHAKVIIDILRASDSFELVGCTDIQVDKEVNGLQVIGDDTILPELFHQGVRHAFIAVGDNRLRHRLFYKLLSIGFDFVNAISPHAVIAQSVNMGKGVAVMPGVCINAEAEIGNNVIINTGTTVDHESSIGESSHLAPGCNIAGNAVIGQGVFVGLGAKVIDKMHIGDWSVIGAGAAVIKSIPSHSLAVGVPAIVKRST
jgi:UDP-perosamine 4-acetyltransferase